MQRRRSRASRKSAAMCCCAAALCKARAAPATSTESASATSARVQPKAFGASATRGPGLAPGDHHSQMPRTAADAMTHDNAKRGRRAAATGVNSLLRSIGEL